MDKNKEEKINDVRATTSLGETTLTNNENTEVKLIEFDHSLWHSARQTVATASTIAAETKHWPLL